MSPSASPATTTAQDRQAHGVRQLGALLNYWLARSNWSHTAMAAVGDWAYGEQSPMQHSVISRCRNANQARGAGLAHLDALAELNQALWLWHERGAAAAIQRYGLPSSAGVEPQWLDDAVWLPKADRPNEPLDLGDFALLVSGRLELPYLSPWQVGKTDASRICGGLGPLLDAIASENSWGPGEATRKFRAAYPSTDKKRLKRLTQLLTGEKPLAPAELEQEIASLAEMIRRVLGLAEYGPTDLLSELKSESRRAG